MLKRVFALIRQMMVGATPTPAVGRVNQAHTTPLGKNSSALDLSQPQPAHIPQSLSSDPAPLTSTEQKHGSEKPTALVEPPLKVAGSKSQTPARQRRQPAKQAQKPAKKRASKTKAAAKRTPVKALARTPTDNQSGANGN